MNYWLIPDTHFGHDNMIEYCGRPLEFEKLIFANIAKTVKDSDLLIHLGDICFGKDEYWHTELQKIRCKKWLVKGNHDSKSVAWYLSHGWDFVCNSFTLNLFGSEILFSHRPVRENGFAINIHGHFHNSDYKRYEPDLAEILTEKHILLALEHNSYLPYNLKTIVEKHNSKKTEVQFSDIKVL